MAQQSVPQPWYQGQAFRYSMLLVVGLIAGLSMRGEAETPEPQVERVVETVVEEVEVPVEVPVEVRVEVAPQACRDAIRYARLGFTNAADAFGVLGVTLEALAVLDFAAVEDATAEMDALSAELTGDISPRFRAAAQECESAS